MKKFLILLLSLMLVVFCSACGTFTPPIVTNPGTNSGDGGESGDGGGGEGETPGPDNPGGDEETGFEFKVTLKMENGAPFYPSSDMNIKAAWTGRNESYSAAFDATGVATVKGLDGAYDVTLTSVPDNFTYDPNGDYKVNNYKRDVTITLMQITPCSGEGTAFFKNGRDLSKRMGNTGTYRAVLMDKSQKVYYLFTPSAAGRYSIQSWVSVSENEVNPMMDHYTSVSTVYVNENDFTTYNSGGKSGSFTKNFKFDLDVSSSYVGNTWGFRVYAEIKDQRSFPVEIDFSVKYEGESLGEGINVQAVGRFDETRANDFTFGSTWHYIYEGEPGNNYLDGSKVTLNWTDTNGNGVWDETDDGDGYYHVLMEDETGKLKLGPTLYVRLTTPSQYVVTTTNGFMDHLAHVGHEDSQGALRLHSLGVDQNRTYYEFIHTYTKYTARHQGMHPVNPELKTFLEDYAICGRSRPLFDDGWGDGDGSLSVSGPDGIWLYCCGYYSNDVIVKNK